MHALRLIGSGLFDEYPRIQIVLGHLGEGLPYSMWRIDRNAWVRRTKHKAKKIVEYFNANFHLTTSGNFRTQTLIDAMLEIGADRILFSTDWPFENIDHAADWFDACSINEADRIKIGRAQRAPVQTGLGAFMEPATSPSATTTIQQPALGEPARARDPRAGDPRRQDRHALGLDRRASLRLARRQLAAGPGARERGGADQEYPSRAGRERAASASWSTSPRCGRRSTCSPAGASTSLPAAATTARSTPFGADFMASAEIFEEGIDVVLKAWNSPGKWSHRGRF